MQPRKRYYLLAVLSLAGLILSGMLSRLYYVLRSGTGGFRSFCNLGDTVNCDAVAASPYAELFSGIPLSSFSGGWFLATCIVSLLGLSVDWRREANRALFLLTGISALFSFIYFFIMAASLRTFCILCVGIDVVAIASFLTVLTLKPESLKVNKPDFSKWKTLIALILGSTFITIVAFKAFDPMKQKPAFIDETVRSFLAQDPLPVKVSDNALSLGNPDAPITIVEFIDFQCPYCKVAAQTVHHLMNRYPSLIRVVLKNFPLDPSCNPQMQKGGHPAACESAKAVICAQKQNKLKEVYEGLFERQSDLAPGLPSEIARKHVPDDAALEACMKSDQTQQRVVQSIEEGVQLGVRSTPTLFVNGRKMEGIAAMPVWDKLIPALTRSR